jgi:hypothetical protein
VTWRFVVYSERRRVLARYAAEAGTAANAFGLGREALLTQHPPTAARRPTSLFEQAQRVGGHETDGWVLYRIGHDEQTR